MPTKYSSKRTQVTQWREPTKDELYNIVEMCMHYAEGYRWTVKVQKLFGLAAEDKSKSLKIQTRAMAWFAKGAGSDSPSSACSE